MIEFHFVGTPFPDPQEQQRDKERFIEKLGPFRQEFEDENGVVTFDYSRPDDDKHAVSFNLRKNPAKLGDFISRWNIYIGGLKGDTA